MKFLGLNKGILRGCGRWTTHHYDYKPLMVPRIIFEILRNLKTDKEIGYCYIENCNQWLLWIYDSDGCIK